MRGEDNGTGALFAGCRVGALTTAHRVVLAPMTRARATRDTLAPSALSTEYYRQRASGGGLLITEATHISPEATPVWTIYSAVRERGGHVPGIWTAEQTRRWRAVTQAVQARGGVISCQLLHAGRVAQPGIADHPLVRHRAVPLPPVSSSAVPLQAGPQAGDYSWDQPSATPRALETDEIARVCGDYRHAARNARRAGFDCVELHAAHGYLIDQFLCDGTNRRTDRYGGSVANRCRLLFEVVAALLDVMGPGRVGVRLSPTTIDPTTGRPSQVYFGATCSEPERTYAHAVSGLNALPLAYLLLTEPRVGGLSQDAAAETAYEHPLRNARYRELFDGTLIGAGGFTPRTAVRAVADGAYDMIAFGRWFLSNPDLPARIRTGHDLNVYDRPTFYGGGAQGYVDYPDRHGNAAGTPGHYPLMEQSRIGPSLCRARAP